LDIFKRKSKQNVEAHLTKGIRMSFLDLTDVSTTQSFEPLPEGLYLVTVQEAELKDTKDNTGKYVKIKLEVTGAEAQNGRVLFHNFNTHNKSEMAQKIGREQLKSFLVASGFRTPDKLTSPKELEGLSAMAMVKIRKDEGYESQNVVTYFKAYDVKAQKTGAVKHTTARGPSPF